MYRKKLWEIEERSIRTLSIVKLTALACAFPGKNEMRAA